MSITLSTIIALLAALLAAVMWGIALVRQWRSGRWWPVCLAAVSIHLYFAGIYLAVLLGEVDSQAVGQTHLRPAVSALFVIMSAVSLAFWRQK